MQINNVASEALSETAVQYEQDYWFRLLMGHGHILTDLIRKLTDEIANEAENESDASVVSQQISSLNAILAHLLEKNYECARRNKQFRAQMMF